MTNTAEEEGRDVVALGPQRCATMDGAASVPHSRTFEPASQKLGVGVQSHHDTAHPQAEYGAPVASDGAARRPAAATSVHVIHGAQGRIACVADIRGQISQLNQIAADTKAAAIVHTGDFGFYTRDSLPRMGERALRQVVQHSPLLSHKLRSVLLESSEPRTGRATLTHAPSSLRQALEQHPEAPLSEFPQLLAHEITLDVPVFTVYGACEDVEVVERLRSHDIQIPNLFLLDEATTHAIDVGGLRLRLLGLGGAVVPHKLFDLGAGHSTIAGGQGTMWTTMLQVGELVETAQHVYDPAEVRVLVSYASPGRDGLVAQLAHALRADMTLSGGLHLRYVSSYNDFGVHGALDQYIARMSHAKEEFHEIWDSVRPQVEAAIDPSQRTLLNHALGVAMRVPQPLTLGASREDAFKAMWHWNLPDAPLGALLLDVSMGRIAAETRSQGLNFASRRTRPSGPAPKVALPTKERAAAGAAPARPPAPTPEAPASRLDTSHTLFLGHLGEAHPVSEADVRAYFGEHAAQIEQVQFFPADRDRRGKDDKEAPRLRNFVHVVFKSDAAATAALACSGRTIKNTRAVPTLERLERPRQKPAKSVTLKADPASGASDDTSAPGAARRSGRRSRGGRGRRSGAHAADAADSGPRDSASKSGENHDQGSDDRRSKPAEASSGAADKAPSAPAPADAGAA